MNAWIEYIRDFEKYLWSERALTENSLKAYLSDIEKLREFVEITKWQLAPEELQQKHLEDFLKYLYELGMSPHSQARILAGLKSFYRFLLSKDLIEDDPTYLLEGPKITRKLPEILTIEEVDRILNAIDLSTPEGTRNRAIVETLYSSGLKVSELTQLTINCVYFDVGFLRIEGRGEKERLVPIGDEALKYLKLYVNEIRSRQNIQPGNSEFVFLNRNGTQLSRVMIFNIVKDLSKLAGIQKNVNPHTFRHSFATHLIEGGANLRAVQDLLGHASIVTTEIYTHLDTDYLRKVIMEYHPRAKQDPDATNNFKD